MAKYCITRKLASGFNEAVTGAKAALEREGFRTTGEFRLDRALQQAIGAGFKRYAVLSSFFPPLTHKALMVDTDIWLLLPCQFVLHEDDENVVTISAIDPVVAMSMIENPALAILANEIKARVTRAVESIE